MGAMARAVTGIYTENAIHFSLIFGKQQDRQVSEKWEQGQHINVQFSAEHGKDHESRDNCRKEKFLLYLS